MISKCRAQWGDAQCSLSNAEMYLQKAISSQKLHNLNLEGERGRRRGNGKGKRKKGKGKRGIKGKGKREGKGKGKGKGEWEHNKHTHTNSILTTSTFVLNHVSIYIQHFSHE